MKRSVGPLSLLALIAALAVVGTAGASHRVNAPVKGSFKYCDNPTFPPLESKTSSGKVVGFDVDMANAIARLWKVKALRAAGAGEASSARVGAMAVEKLRAIDQIAYIRFASVYQSFEDLEDLKREVDTLYATRGDLPDESTERSSSKPGIRSPSRDLMTYPGRTSRFRLRRSTRST